MSTPIQPETVTTPPQDSDPFAEQREAVRQQVEAETRAKVLAEAAQIYGGAITDAERRAREAQEALNARTTAPATPKPVESTEYFADPVTHTRQLIREELAQAVAPLNQLALETRNANNYANAKNQLRMHPNVGQHLAQIEPILDQEARFLQQVDVNSVGALAVNIIGRAYAGMIPGVTLGSITTPRPVAPPQVPPAGARPPAPVAPVIELTEQQRAVARFQGMTDEQYLAYLNSNGSIESLRAVK